MNQSNHIEDCFSILEIPISSTIDDVKQARRELAYVWHPDRFSNNPLLQERATRKLRDINTAYDRLVHYFRDGDHQNRVAIEHRAGEKRADEAHRAELRRQAEEKQKKEELLRLKSELQMVKMEYEASIRKAEEARVEAVKRLEIRWRDRYQRVRALAIVMSILFLCSVFAHFILP